jgi:hypothetical protein
VKTVRAGPASYTVSFDSEEELRSEHRVNLSMGGLRLETAEKLALHSTLTVTLRGPSGAEEVVRATVVAPLPGGVALALAGSADGLLGRLLAAPEEATEATETEVEASGEREKSTWDRIRGLGRTEKLQLAPKAERSERALLLQDNDPQVLFSLLRNPRLTVDEVVRIAKSPYLTYQTAEVMMKSTLWVANVDVRVALIHNPKTPQAFALRLLPTLPESEVKLIARGAATSMALKTAALRRLQTGS